MGQTACLCQGLILSKALTLGSAVRLNEVRKPHRKSDRLAEDGLGGLRKEAISTRQQRKAKQVLMEMLYCHMEETAKEPKLEVGAEEVSEFLYHRNQT